MRSVRLRRVGPWLGVAIVMAIVFFTSARGYGLARDATGRGFGWSVRWGVPILLAAFAWRASRIYERLGVAWGVAKPWVVVGMGVQAMVLLLGDSDTERYHVLTFGLLGLALAWALIPDYGFVVGGALVVLLGTALGLSDEIFQGFLPDRVYDPHDVVKDALGIAAAFAFTCPFAPRLGRPPRTLDRPLATAAAVLAAAVVTCLVLGTRPAVARADVIGTWTSLSSCGLAETYDLKRDGSARWRDAEGNDADGVWSVESTAFEAILKIQPKRVSNSRRDCGLQPSKRWMAKIDLDGARLVLPQFGRVWTRQPEPERRSREGLFQTPAP